MTAPTTRETADHAELARLAEAAAPYWHAANLACGGNPIAVDLVAPFVGAMSPSVCSALLSEIAALRGEVERVQRECDEMSLHGFHAVQAERQRDEARDTIASTVAKADWMQGQLSGERSSIGRETIELVVSECRAYCHLQDLANQGADQ